MPKKQKRQPEPAPQLACLSHMPEVEVASFSHSTRLWRGFQTTWDLCAVVEGESEWRYRKASLSSTPGSIRFKEPGESFQTLKVRAPSSMRILRLSAPFVERLQEELDKTKSHLRQAQSEDPVYFQQLMGVFDALGRACSKLEQETIIYEQVWSLLSRQLEQEPPPVTSPTHPGVRRVMEYIHTHYQDELSLDTLAAIAEVHPVYLSRMFRKQVGLPPHTYQNERRIFAARALLKDGMTGAEVALEVGFFDQSHLIRHFKRFTNITPKDYVGLVKESGPTSTAGRSTGSAA